LQSDIDLHQLVNAIGDAVIVADTDGTITAWNKAAERMFGFRRSEALNRLLVDLIIPEKQRLCYWNGYHKTVQTGKTRYANNVLQGAVIDKEGRSLAAEITVALLYSYEKKVTGVVIIVRDDADCFNDERMVFSGT
jgi:PAS domain S-box-containing protein